MLKVIKDASKKLEESIKSEMLQLELIKVRSNREKLKIAY